MHDVVFSHATVVDGTGCPSYVADVAVDGDRITAIGLPGSLQQEKMVDAKGLVLAPGFIDFHSHADFTLATPVQEELLYPFLRQGVTTFAGGNCGFSPFPVNDKCRDIVRKNSLFLLHDSFSFAWETLEEFAEKVHEKGSLVNAVLLTGHGSLRAFVKGNDPSLLTADEHRMLSELIDGAKAQGAIGISLGLSYIPSMFADESELETIFTAAARNDLLITIHGHTYSKISPFFDQDSTTPHNVKDIELFASMAVKTGAKLHLSHLLLKGSKTWETLPQVFETIHRAIEQGADITFGVIPYHWGNTLIKTLLPNWFLEKYEANVSDKEAVARLGVELERSERLIGRNSDDLILLWGGESDALRSHEGKTFKTIAEERGLSETETILWIIKESDGAARILTASYSGKEGVYSEPLHRLMKHERAMIEIDAIVTDTSGPQTPAAYGAFPRLLGTYSRREHLFTLEEAVHRITGKPAARLGLADRGLLRVGWYADLVLFDAATIDEAELFGSGSIEPKGIRQVWLNGSLVIEDGKRTSEGRKGKVLLNAK